MTTERVMNDGDFAALRRLNLWSKLGRKLVVNAGAAPDEAARLARLEVAGLVASYPRGIGWSEYALTERGLRRVRL
jgi:hypothetical protein